MSDSDSDSFGVITRKGRIYRKRVNANESHEKMIKYYRNPEKRTKLLERIKNYKDAVSAMQEKIAKLEQYLVAENSDVSERTENSWNKFPNTPVEKWLPPHSTRYSIA